jgi:ribonuclease BN (tRNA processing enzyme)
MGTVLIALVLSTVAVAENSSPSNEWITLGTMGGPIPNATHSQPANALVVGDNAYFVDVGDGAAGRLVTAGHSIKNARAVFISHLHFDHTGGLPALIALRWQVNAPGMLTIYGPPGTKQSVEGIFKFMEYGAAGHYGVPGQKSNPPNHNVNVVEITDGSVVKLDDFTLTAIRNSHYSWPKGSKEWDKYQALSFKFELSDRTIVYTGDTGPSDAVVALAKDADLYVSEMMDIDYTVALVKRLNPKMPNVALKNMEAHLRNHHVTPEQVGDMAARAGVKRVVVTHMAPGEDDPTKIAYYTNRVKAAFDGDVVLAKDLDSF